MYYRRGFYPRPGQADVPDDLWEEFQRIRGHLSRVDQNNVENFSIAKNDIVTPDTLDHAGVTDIVGVDGEFLHKEFHFQGDDLVEIGRAKNFHYEGRWYDLGTHGALLRGHSRGDAPWIVAASIDFNARDGKRTPRELEQLSQIAQTTETSTVDSHFGSGHTVPASQFTGTLGAALNLDSGELTQKSVTRVNVFLRIKTKDGISAAEAVGGADNYSVGGSLAVVTCSFAGGGPVEFSPVVRVSENHLGAHNKANWACSIHRVNIFAFGLYR